MSPLPGTSDQRRDERYASRHDRRSRQAGKTTLAKKIGDDKRPYVTLDDEGVYQATTTDPVSFIRQFECVTIDEIQRVPELIREIKISVDQDQRPGRFLLTGSANIFSSYWVEGFFVRKGALLLWMSFTGLAVFRRIRGAGLSPRAV
ncbi:MAG: AAA family ATPase [Rhodospirillaceae bacterium]|nr:AAA family ATPase [Rhodospirillaceae bacterium]